MDRLGRLTERLAKDLDQQAAPSRECLEPALLEGLVMGTLDSPSRERADAHVETCLACLNRFVELRDDLSAIGAPGRVSPQLRQDLAGLLGRERREGPWRRLFAWRVPAWAVVGAAACLLLTWMVVARYHTSAGVEWPFPDSSGSARLTPAHFQTVRTVSGVVSSIGDATSDGVEAHVISLKDAAGTTYVLFAWGPVAVKPGESVEVDAIFTDSSQSAGRAVHQGVVTELRRTR